MSGIPCTFDENHAPAAVLITWLETGATINLCPDDVAPGLINILATDLGIEPLPFYENVKRYVDRMAKKAAKDAEQDTAESGSGGAAGDGGESTPVCQVCGDPMDNGESHLHGGTLNPAGVP